MTQQHYHHIRACTTAIITPFVYHIFCKNVPGKLGDGWGRRLTRRRLRLVLPSSRDGRCSVVRASSLGYTRSGSSCGRAWWLRAPELSPVLAGDGAMSIGARDDGTMLGRGTGKEEQGCSHCGGVPTFTDGGNGLVAMDSSTSSSGTIDISSFDNNRGCTGCSLISPHL